MIRQDCRHFRANSPCYYHKRNGIRCDDCGFFDPINKKILIIKLAALGDVLRTTGLLNAIKRNYPYSHITWITENVALPLFEHIELVDSLLDAQSNLTLLTLSTTKFDTVFSLETDPESAMLAFLAKADKKHGFVYSEKGYIIPQNQEAKYWFQMGVSDELKKANNKTYQQIMYNICELDCKISAEPILVKNNLEDSITTLFKKENGICENDTVIGIFTGAGRRWPMKKWTVEGYIRLITCLIGYKKNIKIVLYGGPEEKKINQTIIENTPNSIINSGCDNSLRKFMALLDVANIVVTGDTLAMHIAIALKKYLLVLIGPTSSHEIDLFNRGEKIISDLDCLCCYKSNCTKDKNCMNSISDTDIFNHITKFLEKK